MFKHPGIAAYQTSQTELPVISAGRAGLVALLLETARDRCRQAATFLEGGQINDKNVATEKAVRILQEGLQGYLDMSLPVSQEFDAFYTSAVFRLLKAQLENDAATYLEIAHQLEELSLVWRELDKQVS